MGLEGFVALSTFAAAANLRDEVTKKVPPFKRGKANYLLRNATFLSLGVAILFR